jgi:hypothetical protein
MDGGQTHRFDNANVDTIAPPKLPLNLALGHFPATVFATSF